MNGHGIAQTQRPAPAPVVRQQRVSTNYQNEAPRPVAAIPTADRPSLAYGSAAQRVY